MMDALDGNAIAGPLFEAFGAEMTAATGVCAHCGNHGVLAELVVFVRAPGSVARCRICGKVVMVIVTARDTTRVYLHGLAALEAAPGPV
jgi:hypothetical protein